MIDIRAIITNFNNDLTLDEVDYYKSLLETGGYKKEYIDEVLPYIDIRKNDIKSRMYSPTLVDKPVFYETSVVLQKGDIDKTIEKKSINEDVKILNYIFASRLRSTNKAELINLLKRKNLVTEDFVSRYILQFTQFELEILLSNLDFTENFLDTYFDILTPKRIGLYHGISESFFIKHINSFDPFIVLNNKKNESWAAPNNRSSKLTTILKLKGF